MSRNPEHDVPAEPVGTASWDPAAIEQELDLRRYERPIPVVIASRVLRELQPGKLLKAIMKDEGHAPDFRALVRRQQAFELVAQQSTDRGHIIILGRRED